MDTTAGLHWNMRKIFFLFYFIYLFVIIRLRLVWQTEDSLFQWGWGCSSVGLAHSWRRFVSPVRQGIFLPESTFSADSLTVSLHPCVQSHTLTAVCTLRSCSPCQSLVDYGNTKTPNRHRRLGSATLLQLAFPRESNLNFPWGKPQWDNTVLKIKNKEHNSWIWHRQDTCTETWVVKKALV